MLRETGSETMHIHIRLKSACTYAQTDKSCDSCQSLFRFLGFMHGVQADLSVPCSHIFEILFQAITVAYLVHLNF